MGRVGSDQAGSARRKIERWAKEDVKADETPPCDSAVLSIRKINESNGKYAHVVECRLATTPSKRSLFTLQRRVFSESRDDPDGRASALRFTFTTDSQPEFRSFLFGKSDNSDCGSPLSATEVSTSAMTDGSGVGAGIVASSSATITAYVCVRQNTLQDLWFTTAVCRLSNGSLRSVSFRNLDKQHEAETGKVATFLRSAASKRRVYRVVNQTLAGGGEAGHCRQNGQLSAKCKRCGGLEHPDCNSQTLLADKQVFEDYICSTCLMAEREEVFSIRVEEQGDGATDLDELRNEAASVYMKSDWRACCICGCEDNEDLDDLIPCLCNVSAALVHRSCASACRASLLPSASTRCSSVQCFICGEQDVQHNGVPNLFKEGEYKAAVKTQGGISTGMKRSLKSIQASGKGEKRSRTTATNGTLKVDDWAERGPSNNNIKREGTESASQAESGDTEREMSGVGLLGRRFSDAPATVPIKKRRIHIPEVVRSPSPCRSFSPRSQSCFPTVNSPTVPSTPPRSPSPVSPTPPARSPSFGSPTPPARSISPKSPSPSPSPRILSSRRSVSLECKLSTGVDDPPMYPVSSVRVEGATDMREEDTAVQPSSPMLALSGFVHPTLPPSELACITHSLSPPPRLPSLSSQENDENLKAEDGVITSVEECFDGEDKDMVDEPAEEVMREASAHSAGDPMDEDPSLENAPGGLLRLRWDLNKEMEAWEKLTDQSAGNQVDASRIEDKLEDTSPTLTLPDSDDSGHERNIDNSVDDVVVAQMDEVLGTEENDDNNSQDCGDVDIQQGKEDEKSSTVLQDESGLNAEAVPGNIDYENPTSWDGETASDGGEGETHEKYAMQEEHQDCAQNNLSLDSKLEKQQGMLRNKAASWDQLPEEIEAEEHVDYGDSDCREADDMGLELDERTSITLQDEGDWKTDEAFENCEVHNPTSWEGEAVSGVADTEENPGGQEEVPKPSVSDSQTTEPSWEKHARSERIKTTGWDQLPEGFDSAEEARRAVKEKSSRGGRGGPWKSSGGRVSMLGSHGALAGGRLGPGRGSSRTDTFPGDRHRSDELLRGRDSFTHGRRLDDSLDVNLKFPLRDVGRGRSFGRGGPGAGMHGRGRAGAWVDPQSGTLGQWGPGRRRSTLGFSLQGPTNAAAAAAAKVESSGFVVAPDGTITKAGSGAVPGRGIRSTIGVGRDVHGVNVGRGSHMEIDGGINFPVRGLGGGRGMSTSSSAGMNAGGRGILSGVGPGLVGGLADRGRSAGRGMIDRYRDHSFSSGGMDNRRSESPRRSLHPLDHPTLNTRVPQNFRPESRVERSNSPPPSHHSLGHSKFGSSVSVRLQRSPPPISRWSNDKRESAAFRERDFKRPVSRPRIPPRRTSPHVVHGSSLMDERDRQVLAGARHSPPARVALSSSVTAVSKSGDGGSETRRSKRDEEDDVRIAGSRSKELDYGRISARESDKDRDISRGSLHRRDRNRDDDRKRDPIKLSGKDGRSNSGHKHASIRDVDDDVAPRRRRPS